MCDQCQVVRINGVACHETGCPNSWKDPITDQPHPSECRWCGTMFTPMDKGEAWCDEVCYAAYFGLPLVSEDDRVW